MNLGDGLRICKLCHREFKSDRRWVCCSCNMIESKKRVIKKIHTIVGHNCWVCGYGGTSAHIPMLDFHHMPGELKYKDISRLVNNNRKWTLILEELRKCILVCKNCHAEIHHSDFISAERVDEIFSNRW